LEENQEEEYATENEILGKKKVLLNGNGLIVTSEVVAADFIKDLALLKLIEVINPELFPKYSKNNCPFAKLFGTRIIIDLVECIRNTHNSFSTLIDLTADSSSCSSEKSLPIQKSSTKENKKRKINEKPRKKKNKQEKKEELFIDEIPLLTSIVCIGVMTKNNCKKEYFGCSQGQYLGVIGDEQGMGKNSTKTRKDVEDNLFIGQMMHTAKTIGGTSGAPLFTLAGELIGLHSSVSNETKRKHGIHLIALQSFLQEKTLVLQS
jgi:hypothetical protein